MNAEKERIVETITHIIKKKEGVIFAYIFGSFAEEGNYRDIDGAVYLEKPCGTDFLQFEFSLEEELERALHVPFDVRVLNEAPLGFIYSVLSKNILLLDRDSTRRAVFESLVYREYFDFQHLVSDYLSEVRNAPL